MCCSGLEALKEGGLYSLLPPEGLFFSSHRDSLVLLGLPVSLAPVVFLAPLVPLVLLVPEDLL